MVLSRLAYGRNISRKTGHIDTFIFTPRDPHCLRQLPQQKTLDSPALPNNKPSIVAFQSGLVGEGSARWWRETGAEGGR